MRDDAPAQATAAPPRWWQRALPMTLLALLVGAGAVAALDPDELALSTSREPQPFVELLLTGAPQQVCRKETVGFQLTSHLEEAGRVRWSVSVRPTNAEKPTDRDQGSVRLSPGGTRSESVRLAAPGRAYDVVVRLPDRPELLRIHCQGARR
ncbi:hypothetical protein [Nocardioides caldifontis]|uniref:hypothetical protein n=1 Tax=Nocardioides caldifontis TaxID=2588938 RepID=UPI0011DFA94C|nr:hypothetical protein [Nocardioides caldifontis]